MDIRREFEKRIERKKQEVFDLERNIAEAKAYMQALLDALKLLPKDKDAPAEEPSANLRPNSDLALTAELLKGMGRPLHIDEILQGIGKPVTKENKASLGTSLGSYARRNMIFTRPMPNTFGLISQVETPSEPDGEEPPSGFGQDQEEEEPAF